MTSGRAWRMVGGGVVIFLAGSTLGGGRAFGDDAPTRVTVIRPTWGDVVLIEIATRAWAELTAGGVAAILLDCPSEPEACPTEGPPPGGNAVTLKTFRRADETITEAALTPDGHDRPTVRRSLTVSDEAAADPKVMAIRAVELVNAMLLQVDSSAAEAAALRRAAMADAEYPGQHFKPDPTPGDWILDPDRRWSLGAGGAFLKGAGGLSAAFGFAVRGSYAIHQRIGVSALLTEAPSRSDTATLDGALSTNQQLAALEVTYRLYRNAHVSAHLAAGGGGYHVNASWRGGAVLMAGPSNSSAALWAALLSAGGGGVMALGHEMSLFTEVRAVLASPNPVVYGVDRRPLKTADPSLLLSLGLQTAF
jgi:hypothetical protein